MPKRRRVAPPGDAFPGGVPTPARVANVRDRYIEAAGEIAGWKPAREVFDLVTSVRTPFVGFNKAIRVGGLPTRRITTIHGPTHGGKTAFVLGLVKGFVDVGFLAGYIDAEFALGKQFAIELVRELESQPNFLACRPKNYEEGITAFDSFLASAGRVRDTYPEAMAIGVVDSINKMVPKRELSKIMEASGETKKAKGKQGSGADELAKGHHGRARAALNQAWLDHLVPLLDRANAALVLIAQEREDADPKDFFRDFKVKGGAALLFDASALIRVMLAQPVFIGAEKKNENIVGFSHRVRIWKNKVGTMDGRWTDCLFHMSNGRLSPPGFDFARDALVTGPEVGVIKQSGSWFSWHGRRWQGEPKAIGWLSERPEQLEELMLEINAAIDAEAGRVVA